MGRGYSALEIECEPRTSVPFWRKHGFQPMTAGRDGFLYAFKLLGRSHELVDGPNVPVVISLFPTERDWIPSTAPYWVRTENGRRQDRCVQLPARVALYQPGEPHHADCTVRVDLDGARVYEDKLKRPGARINRDPGGFYYVDSVR